MTAMRSLVYQTVFLVWTTVLCSLYLPLLWAPRPWVQFAARLWLRGTQALVAAICGLRYEVRGREHLPAGPLIVASKHQSAWETLVFHLLVADPAYVLKEELLSLPLVGRYMRKSGMIAIDRQAGTKALKIMMDGARRAIAEGRQIVIFPEGTRTAPGTTTPYHSGVAMLYTALDVPVVPVALNSGLFWRRNSFLRRSGVITLEFLPPIPPGLERKLFMRLLAERIETASRRLQAEAENRFPWVAVAAEAVET